MAKFCMNCGEPLNDNSTFCMNCGQKVNDSSAAKETARTKPEKKKAKDKTPKPKSKLMNTLATAMIAVAGVTVGYNLLPDDSHDTLLPPDVKIEESDSENMNMNLFLVSQRDIGYDPFLMKKKYGDNASKYYLPANVKFSMHSDMVEINLPAIKDFSQCFDMETDDYHLLNRDALTLSGQVTSKEKVTNKDGETATLYKGMITSNNDFRMSKEFFTQNKYNNTALSKFHFSNTLKQQRDGKRPDFSKFFMISRDKSRQFDVFIILVCDMEASVRNIRNEMTYKEDKGAHEHSIWLSTNPLSTYDYEVDIRWK